MKRIAPAIVLLVIIFSVPFLIAMGMFQGTPDRVPKTEKKVSATYVDQNDVITECTDASIEGHTFLEGKRGQGTFTVDFDRIKSITFRLSNGELKGIVAMKDGSDVALTMGKDKKAYGKTRFGTYQIRLADLKKMTINSVTEPERKTSAPQ